jgi:hypothetical protein
MATNFISPGLTDLFVSTARTHGSAVASGPEAEKGQYFGRDSKPETPQFPLAPMLGIPSNNVNVEMGQPRCATLHSVAHHLPRKARIDAVLITLVRGYFPGSSAWKNSILTPW